MEFDTHSRIYLKWVTHVSKRDVSERDLFICLKKILNNLPNKELNLNSSHTMKDNNSLVGSSLPFLIEGLTSYGYSLVTLQGIDEEALLMCFALRIHMENYDDKE